MMSEARPADCSILSTYPSAATRAAAACAVRVSGNSGSTASATQASAACRRNASATSSRARRSSPRAVYRPLVSSMDPSSRTRSASNLTCMKVSSFSNSSSVSRGRPRQSHAPARSAASRSRWATGAWDCLGLPLDTEELLLKLETFMHVKLEADRVREEGSIEDTSGLYTARGLERRARELVADAFRRHAALACVALAAEPEFPDTRTAQAAAARVAALG